MIVVGCLSHFCPFQGAKVVQKPTKKFFVVLQNQMFSRALLTIYDMCKAADRAMVISDVKLLEKHGGKSGSFVA